MAWSSLVGRAKVFSRYVNSSVRSNSPAFTLKNYLGSVQLIIIGSCTSSSSSPRSTTAESRSTTKINMAAGDEAWKSAKSIYDFCVTDIEGNEVSLDKYKGKVCLIVNVASK